MFRLANCTRQNSVCCTHAADRITMKQSRRFALLDSSVKVPTKRIRRHFHPRNNQNKGTNNLQSSFQCLYISPSIVACFVSTLVGLLCESRGPSVTFTERKNCLLEKHPRHRISEENLFGFSLTTPRKQNPTTKGTQNADTRLSFSLFLFSC